jgi:hypothetical protein
MQMEICCYYNTNVTKLIALKMIHLIVASLVKYPPHGNKFQTIFVHIDFDILRCSAVWNCG